MHDSHDELELAETAPLKTGIRSVKVAQTVSITESWNLKLQWDGVGEPSQEDWEDWASEAAITANDILTALMATYPNRKFEVEVIETTEIDV